MNENKGCFNCALNNPDKCDNDYDAYVWGWCKGHKGIKEV